MNFLNAPRGVVLIAAAIAMAGISACGERESDLSELTTASGLPSTASPSAVVIGVAPAEPSSDTAQTTPVAAEAKADKVEVQAKEQTYQMPWPGQPNDHSNLAPNPSQKAEAVEPRPVEPAKAQDSNPQAYPERKTQ